MTSSHACGTEGGHEPAQGEGGVERTEMIGQTLFPLCLFRAQRIALAQASSQACTGQHTRRDVMRSLSSPSKQPGWKNNGNGALLRHQIQLKQQTHYTTCFNTISTSSYGSCISLPCTRVIHSTATAVCTLCCAAMAQRPCVAAAQGLRAGTVTKAER